MGKKKLLTGRVFLTLAYYLTTTRINQRFFNSTRLSSPLILPFIHRRYSHSHSHPHFYTSHHLITMGLFTGILSSSSSSKDKTPSIDTTTTIDSVSDATMDKQSPSESVCDSKIKTTNHPGWDLPAHIIQLMSIPVDQAVAQLLKPLSKDEARTRTPASAATPNAFMDAMKAVPKLTRTENGAAAYTTTDSPLVDLFFDLSPPVDAEHLFELLGKAWAVDPQAYVPFHLPMLYLLINLVP